MTVLKDNEAMSKVKDVEIVFDKVNFGETLNIFFVGAG